MWAVTKMESRARDAMRTKLRHMRQQRTGATAKRVMELSEQTDPAELLETLVTDATVRDKMQRAIACGNQDQAIAIATGHITNTASTDGTDGSDEEEMPPPLVTPSDAHSESEDESPPPDDSLLYDADTVVVPRCAQRQQRKAAKHRKHRRKGRTRQ